MTRATYALAAIMAVASLLMGCPTKGDDEWEIKPEETYVEPAPADKGDEAAEVEGEGIGSGPMEFTETVLDDPTYGMAPYAVDDPFVQIETEKGVMIAELYQSENPKTVENFVKLVKLNYYDGLDFHRVIRDFMVQGGDNGTGPGWSIDLEISDVKHAAGTLSMARTDDPNSAGAQFFICHKYSTSCHALDGQYAAFGRLVYGMDVVEAIVEATADLPGASQKLQTDDAVKILSTKLMTWDEVDAVLNGDGEPTAAGADEAAAPEEDAPAE